MLAIADNLVSNTLVGNDSEEIPNNFGNDSNNPAIKIAAIIFKESFNALLKRSFQIADTVQREHLNDQRRFLATNFLRLNTTNAAIRFSSQLNDSLKVLNQESTSRPNQLRGFYAHLIHITVIYRHCTNPIITLDILECVIQAYMRSFSQEVASLPENFYEIISGHLKELPHIKPTLIEKKENNQIAEPRRRKTFIECCCLGSSSEDDPSQQLIQKPEIRKNTMS